MVKVGYKSPIKTVGLLSLLASSLLFIKMVLKTFRFDDPTKPIAIYFDRLLDIMASDSYSIVF